MPKLKTENSEQADIQKLTQNFFHCFFNLNGPF